MVLYSVVPLELHGNDLTNLTPRLKSLQHNTLQPQRVGTLNVLAISHCRAMLNNEYHYMHIWLVEAVWLIGFAKSHFSLLQRNIFYLTTKFVENIENGKPHLNPN